MQYESCKTRRMHDNIKIFAYESVMALVIRHQGVPAGVAIGLLGAINEYERFNERFGRVAGFAGRVWDRIKDARDAAHDLWQNEGEDISPAQRTRPPNDSDISDSIQESELNSSNLSEPTPDPPSSSAQYTGMSNGKTDAQIKDFLPRAFTGAGIADPFALKSNDIDVVSHLDACKSIKFRVSDATRCTVKLNRTGTTLAASTGLLSGVASGDNWYRVATFRINDPRRRLLMYTDHIGTAATSPTTLNRVNTSAWNKPARWDELVLPYKYFKVRGVTLKLIIECVGAGHVYTEPVGFGVFDDNQNQNEAATTIPASVNIVRALNDPQFTILNNGMRIMPTKSYGLVTGSTAPAALPSLFMKSHENAYSNTMEMSFSWNASDTIIDPTQTNDGQLWQLTNAAYSNVIQRDLHLYFNILDRQPADIANPNNATEVAQANVIGTEFKINAIWEYDIQVRNPLYSGFVTKLVQSPQFI